MQCVVHGLSNLAQPLGPVACPLVLGPAAHGQPAADEPAPSFEHLLWPSDGSIIHAQRQGRWQPHQLNVPPGPWGGQPLITYCGHSNGLFLELQADPTPPPHSKMAAIPWHANLCSPAATLPAKRGTPVCRAGVQPAPPPQCTLGTIPPRGPCLHVWIRSGIHMQRRSSVL